MKRFILSSTIIAVIVSLSYCKSNNNPTDENNTPTETTETVSELPEDPASEDLVEETLVEETYDREGPSSVTTLKNSEGKEIPEWAGTYTNENGFTLEVKNPASDGATKFRLLQMNQECIGDIDEMAYLIGPIDAEFYAKESNCMVKLKLIDDGVIQVMEADCSDYRGPYCQNFSGKYYKDKK